MDEKGGTNSKKSILERLHRIEGQLRGVSKMIEEERPCEEVMLQLAAVKAAVVQAAMKILESQLSYCLKNWEKEKNIEEKWHNLMEIFRKFA